MDGQDLISIGDLAAQTGISVDTIRVWERRYGQPIAHRLPSGHRRYAKADVRRLRRVAEALSLGHRPSRVLALDETALDHLLGGNEPEDTGICLDIEQRLARIRRFDSPGLLQDLAEARSRVGTRVYLVEHLMGLSIAVGRAWADGHMEIRHEHFATQLLLDQVRSVRESCRTDPHAPRVVIATLPGEHHSLGVQVAAAFTALGGALPLLLGTNIPAAEIAGAANDASAVAVAISVTLATGGVETDREIAALRDGLRPGIDLFVGGAGARGPRRGPRSVRYVDTFERFELEIAQIAIAGDTPRFEARIQRAESG